MLNSDTEPLVSIIIPTLNGEKWIAQTLRSACNQTYKRIEIIVVDNGSEDRTLEIVEDFSRKDKRIKIVQNREKKGVAVSRNVGIKNSEGDYISFLDQDDIYLPFKTEVQVRFMEQYPMVGICYGGLIASDMGKIASYYPPGEYNFFTIQVSLIAETICGSCSTLIRREVFDIIGLLDEDINKADDYDLLCRAVKVFPVLPFPNSPVYIYRNHSGQSSLSDAGKYRWACDYAALKHFWSIDEKIWGKNKVEISQNVWDTALKIYAETTRRINNSFHFPRFDTILEMMKFSNEIFPTAEKEEKIKEFEESIKNLKHFRFSPNFPPSEFIRITDEDKNEIRKKVSKLKERIKYAQEIKPYFHEYFIKRRRKKISVNINSMPKIEIVLVGGKDKDTLDSISSQGYPVYIKVLSPDTKSLKKSELKGDFIGFIFSGDLLRSKAIYEVVEAIISGADIVYTDEGYSGRKLPALKPDFSPHTLEFFNYISQFTVIRKELLKDNILFEGFWFWETVKHAVGKVRAEYRTFDKLKDKIKHIRRVLYINKGKARWEIEEKLFKPEIRTNKLVSIIIPNKDNANLLERCIRSIFQKSTYRNFEVVVVENNLKQEETFELYRKFQDEFGEKFRILDLGVCPFNFSRLLNEGEKKAEGDILLFLNNDTEVINPDWLEQMLYFAELDDVACVGAYLIFPNGRVQHIGVSITKEYAGKSFPWNNFFGENEINYFNIFKFPRDVSAMTGDCLMIRRDVFHKIGGFDENIWSGYGDVDLCLRAIKNGYFNVVTPLAKLIHYERATRSQRLNSAELEDVRIFFAKHKDFLSEPDPFASDLLYIKDKENLLMRYYGYGGVGGYTNV